MTATAPEPFALFPLTVFDRLFERTTFVTGWLVKGTIDAKELGSALDRVTQKWRTLAGRLHSEKSGDETIWYIRIPLSPQLPENYATYSLTTHTSELSLSHYVPIPLTTVTSSLPQSLFIDSSTPRQYSLWESTSHPLTCWHLTYFPANSIGQDAYTCIGFARCHGIFDGVGASLVMNALVAEMHQKEWDVPPLPNAGYLENPLQNALNPIIQAHEQSQQKYPEYDGFSVLGITGALKLAAWHMREKWWRGAERKIVLFPKDALSALVREVRTELEKHIQNGQHITTGDILVAWVIKTVYAHGTSPNTIVHCSNVASFRPHMSTGSNSLLNYLHNAFTPLPYPVISVDDIQSLPLHKLTKIFASSRELLLPAHIAASHNLLKTSVTCFPKHPDADETLLVSNVSASRILESDWSAVGGELTLCGYRYQLTPTDFLWTNAVFLAGRLADGSAVLDLTLSKNRLQLLVDEVQRIVATC